MSVREEESLLGKPSTPSVPLWKYIATSAVSFAVGVALCALVAGIVFSPLTRPDPWTQWEKMTTFPSFGAEMKQKLFLIDANVTALNHGSYGAASLPTIAMERRWMSETQANTLEWFSYKVRPMLREIRAKLATYLSVPTSTVVFVENASQGINAVVRSLNFKPTDTVLLTNVTYGMARNAVLFAQKRFGFSIVTIDLSFPTDENQIIAAFRPHLEGGNVTLALFDHISSGPAVIFPLDKLIPMAKENGAMVLVDGAHAVGQVPLNLTALNPDFYVSNGHKWMCSPPGSAFLYVRSELQYLIHPTVISFGYNPTLNNTYVAEFEWIGTRDFSAWLAWKTALELRLNLTDTAVHAYNNDLCLNASQLFIDRWPGAYRLAPSNMTASLTNVVIPCNNKGNNSTAGCYVGWDLVSLYDELHTKWNIWPFITELYPGGPRYIRLSCQIYLSLADYELLATAMDSVISWN